MDLDSIITFLFIILFFVLPGILKKFKAVKKKDKKPKKIKKKPSVVDTIGQRIQRFIRGPEQQNLQQRQKEGRQDSQWGRFSEDEISPHDFESPDPEDVFVPTQPGVPEPEIPEAQSSAHTAAVKEPADDINRQNIKKSLSDKKPVMQHMDRSEYVFRSNPLQNAVIWSEILGKPVGLKE